MWLLPLPPSTSVGVTVCEISGPSADAPLTQVLHSQQSRERKRETTGTTVLSHLCHILLPLLPLSACFRRNLQRVSSMLHIWPQPMHHAPAAQQEALVNAHTHTHTHIRLLHPPELRYGVIRRHASKFTTSSTIQRKAAPHRSERQRLYYTEHRRVSAHIDVVCLKLWCLYFLLIFPSHQSFWLTHLTLK